MKKLHLLRDDRGAAMVEIAFALPAFIVLLWSMVQLGLVYRANSGIQNALGQGARYATLYPTPTDADIAKMMNSAVYGIGPGHFTPVVTDVPDKGYKDLKVTYRQKTDLLLFPGPTITVTKQKRVWVASTGGAIPGGTEEDTGTGSETGTGTGTTDTGTGGGTTTDTGGTGTGTTTGGTGTTTDSGTGGTTTGGTTTGGTTTGGTTTGGTTTGGTTTGNNGNGNGNGNNTVCTKKNGKAC